MICQEDLTPPVTALLQGSRVACTHTFHPRCIREYIQEGFNKCPLCASPFDSFARGWIPVSPAHAQRAEDRRRAAQIVSDGEIALQAQDALPEVLPEVLPSVSETQQVEEEGTIGHRVSARHSVRERVALQIWADRELAAHLQGEEDMFDDEEEEGEEEEEYQDEYEDEDGVPCEVCGRPDGASTFLLCDRQGCPRGAHVRCVGLTRVPRGRWFCPPCSIPSLNALRCRRYREKRRALMGDAAYKANEAWTRQMNRVGIFLKI